MKLFWCGVSVVALVAGFVEVATGGPNWLGYFAYSLAASSTARIEGLES